jgi:hypothetical protein
MRRRHSKMHGLGKLSPGCEIHTFADGSRKKACPKRKVSAKAKSAWMKNLKAACSKKGAPSKACKKVK